MSGDPSRRAVLMAVAAALAAPAASGAAGDPGPVAHRVEIRKFRFAPARLAVRPGDTITWTNRDIAPHTATAADGGWDTGTLARGQSATLTVAAGMRGEYHCRLHPMMKAALTIAPAG